MQAILPTQANLIATVQQKYMNAIANSTPQEVAFWCGQLAELVAQHKVMKEIAGDPVIVAKHSVAAGVNLPREQWERTKIVRESEALLPVTPKEPTQYNWDDGFQGVELSDEWNK